MPARERLALDVTVFAAILLAANPIVTGIALHEWIGAALLAPALVHLVVNWDWVLGTISRFFAKIRTASRVNLVVDSALFVSLVGVTVSGFLVIPGLAASLGLQASSLWHVVHLTTSNLSIGLTLAHLVLHAQWIADVVRRMAAPAAAPRTSAAAQYFSAGQPATAPAHAPRPYPTAHPAERR